LAVDWSAVPVFGSRAAGFPYVIRPSAYAIVRNRVGAVLVVRTQRGLFLPGGGIEGAETSASAVSREANEECAVGLQVGPLVGRAVEIVSAPDEGTCFEKRSEFFEASVLPSVNAAGNGLWMAVPEALRDLRPESHRWALRQLRSAT